LISNIINRFRLKRKIGASVIYTGSLKMLDAGTIGRLESVHSDFCVIIYPQNSSYQNDDVGGWRPIKGSPNQIYCHSVKFNEVKIIK